MPLLEGISIWEIPATSRRAPKVEAALNGREWNEATVKEAMQLLAQDYTPQTQPDYPDEYRCFVMPFPDTMTATQYVTGFRAAACVAGADSRPPTSTDTGPSTLITRGYQLGWPAAGADSRARMAPARATSGPPSA